MKPWSDAEHELLAVLYDLGKATSAIGSVLGRTRLSVRSRVNLLGLNRDTRKRWTAAEDRRLRRLYPAMATAEVAALFHCSGFSIYARANGMGINKTEEHRAKMRVAAGHYVSSLGLGHRFQKGDAPANKGLRRPGWAPGRMAETQFKKGQRPHSWKPIGSIRRDEDGYLQRKMTDTGYPPRDWVAIHILKWRKKHGPVPKGHCLWFKDGDKKNVKLGNLEMITHAERMRRNSVHRLPKELEKIILLKGVLKRRINRLEKERYEERNSRSA